MDTALFVALSRQAVLRREMDVVANNIANVDTAGFKVESLISETESRPVSAGKDSGPRNVQYVLDKGLARDFGQGAMTTTGAPLDVAIEGDGFFQINTDAGERYTRDGRFTVDPAGVLVTASGHPVGGEGGAEILIDPKKGPVTIARDGIISQGEERIGKLGVVRFASLAGLSKDGDGLYRNDANVAAQAAPDAVLHQGSFEGSNVNAVLEVTRMIEVTREYEKISKLMDQTAELDRRSIERLGRVN
jgi:flagellar basal-body rod protein FlgF